MTPSRSKLISTALRRGLRKRCPHCGEGRLFSGWSHLERCSICGLVFARNPGDTWAFTIIGDRLPIGRDDRLDLFRSGAFASCAGPDDAGCVGGAADLDGPQPLGRGYRAALLVASVLARSRGSYSAASCDRPSLVKPSAEAKNSSRSNRNYASSRRTLSGNGDLAIDGRPLASRTSCSSARVFRANASGARWPRFESCDAMLVVGTSQSRHKSQRPRHAQGHRPVRVACSRVRCVAATAASRPR